MPRTGLLCKYESALIKHTTSPQPHLSCSPDFRQDPHFPNRMLSLPSRSPSSFSPPPGRPHTLLPPMSRHNSPSIPQPSQPSATSITLAIKRFRSTSPSRASTQHCVGSRPPHPPHTSVPTRPNKRKRTRSQEKYRCRWISDTDSLQSAQVTACESRHQHRMLKTQLNTRRRGRVVDGVQMAMWDSIVR